MFISLSVTEKKNVDGDHVDIVAVAQGNLDGGGLPERHYNERVTFHGTKKFFEDRNRMILFAHKLQSYAMELLEAEE